MQINGHKYANSNNVRQYLVDGDINMSMSVTIPKISSVKMLLLYSS